MSLISTLITIYTSSSMSTHNATQGMFLDMNLSKEIMDSYRTCELCTSSPFDVDIQTLTNSHWSMKPQPPVRLPPIVSECCDHFNAFYLDKFKTGRRLSWLTHVGGADLKVQ